MILFAGLRCLQIFSSADIAGEKAWSELLLEPGEFFEVEKMVRGNTEPGSSCLTAERLDLLKIMTGINYLTGGLLVLLVVFWARRSLLPPGKK